MLNNRKGFYCRAVCLAISVLALPSALLACHSEPIKSYWKTDIDGYFYTNILERAQEQIPFTIVLPTYLPENIDKLNVEINSLLKSVTQKDVVEVFVDYVPKKAGDKGSIDIYEWNYPHRPPDPKIDPHAKAIEIAGLTVVESVSYDIVAGSLEGIPADIFEWNQNTIFYRVKLYNYPSAECLKVIESMID